MKHFLLIISLLLASTLSQAQQQQYTRLKGYYRVYQLTNQRLTYFIDGMMELYVPIGMAGTDSTQADSKRTVFVDRKFLGERRRKATDAGEDDILARMALPAPEVTPLIESLKGDEYSTRNNGDVYRWADRCGNIRSAKGTVSVQIDELTGREGHELDLSELKMYGIVARMTAYDDTETYGKRADGRYTLADLKSASKRQTLYARYRGEDEDERIDIVSELFITDSATIDKAALKRIKKEKTPSMAFSVPSAATPLDASIERAWAQLREY